MKLRKNQAGFSLIEILIAIGIFAGLAITIAEVMANVYVSKGELERRADLNHTVEIGLAKIYDDINMAFLSDPTFHGKETAQVSAFIGEAAVLDFTTMSHVHYVKNYHDSDQVDVGYLVEKDREGRPNLMRRETDFLQSKVNEGGRSFVLIPGVESFVLEYYDANQKSWKGEWDTNSVEFAGSLPSRVRVKLTVLGEPEGDDEKGRKYDYEIIVPLEMAGQKISF